MYRQYRGPDYYSFTYGGVHFVALNTLMPDDSAYYGRVDSLQLAWLRRDLATIAPGVPVVTFNHIPMVSAWELFTGFADMALVASVRQEKGITKDRHTVANVLEVRKAMARSPFVQTEGGLTRFEQASAVVGSWDNGELVAPSGITVYTVRDGVIDAGRFVRLDPLPKTSGR